MNEFNNINNILQLGKLKRTFVWSLELQNLRTIVKIILFREITALTTFVNLRIGEAGHHAPIWWYPALGSCNIRQIILNNLFTNSLSWTSFRRCHQSNMKLIIIIMNRFICWFSFSWSSKNLKNDCQRLDNIQRCTYCATGSIYITCWRNVYSLRFLFVNFTQINYCLFYTEM